MIKKLRMSEGSGRRDVNDLVNLISNYPYMTENFDILLSEAQSDLDAILRKCKTMPDTLSLRRMHDDLDEIFDGFSDAYSKLYHYVNELKDFRYDIERKYGRRVESKSRLCKKRSMRERKQYVNDSDLAIDMWHDDEFNTRDYAVDCQFYPNDGVYRGNIYRLSDGRMVGDYSCSDSVTLEKELGIEFK